MRRITEIHAAFLDGKYHKKNKRGHTFLSAGLALVIDQGRPESALFCEVDSHSRPFKFVCDKKYFEGFLLA